MSIEIMAMIDDESYFIRDSVRESVENILWLDTVKKEDEVYKHRLSVVNHQERCMICTLPLGTCEHTTDWRQKREEERYIESIKSELDMELDSLLDGVGGKVEYNFDQTSQPIDIDLDHMHWDQMESRPSDKIGHSAVALYTPDDRMWHTSTLIADKFVIVFGGFRFQ